MARNKLSVVFEKRKASEQARQSAQKSKQWPDLRRFFPPYCPSCEANI